MAFFARPDLSNEQFKQLVGSELTLSGQTQILTTSGLTLSDGAGGKVVITADQAASHVGDVLTYDGVGNIKLLPSGAGGDPIYPMTCKSPAAITLGGISAGSPLSGCKLSYIIEELLVPTLNPVLTPPSSIFTISSLSSSYEVGCVVNAVGCTMFNRGLISPVYCGGPSVRSGLPAAHNYVDFNGVTCSCLGTSLNCSYPMPPYTVAAGVRYAYGSVSYAAGLQPKDSSGGAYSTPLPAGTTPIPPNACAICGVYPYFYGKIASGGAPAGSNRPTPTTICSCIIALDLSKATGYIPFDSTGTITINWNSTPDDYIWFAIPTASASKVKWADTVVIVNNGNIGGSPPSAGGNLFPDFNNVSSISTICWSSQTYKVYISNYQTKAINPIALTNS